MEILDRPNRAFLTAYNVVFPIWMLLIIPNLIPVTLVANFLIDGAVISFYLVRVNKFPFFRAGDGPDLPVRPSPQAFWRYLLMAVVAGYVADFMGMGVMLLAAEMLPHAVLDIYRVYTGLVSVAVHLLVVLLVGLLVFAFHLWAGRRLLLTWREAFGLGLAMGIITAPWFFLIPTAWFRW
ncbi:MAG: hypothetical protein AB1497_10190 [Bacillota bacterium]